MRRWITYNILPCLFWAVDVGTILAGFFVGFRVLHVKTLARWLSGLYVGGVWLVSLILAAVVVCLVGQKYPKTWSRHDGACGMGDYWNLFDWIATHVIIGVLVVVTAVVATWSRGR